MEVAAPVAERARTVGTAAQEAKGQTDQHNAKRLVAVVAAVLAAVLAGVALVRVRVGACS